MRKLPLFIRTVVLRPAATTATLLALAFLAACTEPESCFMRTADVFSGGDDALYVHTGETQTLQLHVPYTAACKDTPSVEVLGPAGAPIPAEVTMDQVNGQVSFTPSSPGWYEVLFHSEMEGGSTRKKRFFVVRDVPERAHQAELPYRCEDLQRTAAGTWLCDGRVLRNGETVQTFPPGSLLSAVGNTVWEYYWDWLKEEGWIRRYEDDGEGALEQWPPNSLAVPHAGAHHLLPTETDLLVLFASAPDDSVQRRLRRFEVVGELLAETASTEPHSDWLYHYESDGRLWRELVDGQLWRDGNTLFVIFTQPPSKTPITSICPYTLSPGAITFDPEPNGPDRGSCQTLGGLGSSRYFSGHLGNGILFEGERTSDGRERKLFLYTRVDRHLEPTVSAVIPGKLEPTYGMRTRTQGRPFILGGSTLLVPRVEEGSFALETYRIAPGFSVAGAHTGLAWGRSSGESNLRTRAYAP
jgi:hypothetical protein